MLRLVGFTVLHVVLMFGCGLYAIWPGPPKLWLRYAALSVQVALSMPTEAVLPKVFMRNDSVGWVVTIANSALWGAVAAAVLARFSNNQERSAKQ